MLHRRLVLVLFLFVGLWLFSGGFVHQAPYAADTLVENPFVADPILDNPVVIPPTNFDFVRPYVPPAALDLEFFSPTPPGGILEPPAPALQDYTFLPWSPLPIGPVARIPEISGIYEFLVPFDLLVIAHEVLRPHLLAAQMVRVRRRPRVGREDGVEVEAPDPGRHARVDRPQP